MRDSQGRDFLPLLFATFALMLLLLPPARGQEVLPLPPRPAGALTGSAFYTAHLGQSQTAQETAVYLAMREGNVPPFLRNLIPVTITETINGQPRTATIYVTADYMAVGTDADYFRIPMSAPLAQWVADLCSASLITRKVSDRIWAAAPRRLDPWSVVYPPDGTPPIDSWERFWDQNENIDGQFAGLTPGVLVAGIKKDVIITPRLAEPAPFPKVAIYGWHQTNGVPIQGRSLVHEDTYRDYSHGTRLMLNKMLLDGEETTVQVVMQDPALHVLLSDEGIQTVLRYPVGPPPVPQEFPYVDNFPSTGRQLPYWTDRFKTHTVISHSPAAPGGDGFVLHVRDTSGGIDTARTGTGSETDYFVQADIWCSFRPELIANGFERVGIFARDNGNGLFTGASSSGVQGNCYGMAWDSGDGRLWCFKTVGGVLTDLNPTPVFRPGTAWRRMRIELIGDLLRFYLDGELILSTQDSTFASGQMGIGYQELFATNANIFGTLADNFIADRITEDPELWFIH